MSKQNVMIKIVYFSKSLGHSQLNLILGYESKKKNVDLYTLVRLTLKSFENMFFKIQIRVKLN